MPFDLLVGELRIGQGEPNPNAPQRGEGFLWDDVWQLEKKKRKERIIWREKDAE